MPPLAGQPRQRGDLTVVRWDVPTAQRWEVFGLPVTCPARTVADLLRNAPAAEALWVVDQCLALGVCASREVARCWRPGERHVRAARALLPLGDPASESALETGFRLMTVQAKVSTPTSQLVIRDAAGRFVARADFGWEAARVIVECDGRDVHAAPEALYADRERQNRLAALGWTVLRVTWSDLRRPEVVLTQLRGLLAANRQGGSHEEIGRPSSRRV
ncbi:MAG: endonuclease domain-containing protein [Mycobacteriales bacterium]